MITSSACNCEGRFSGVDIPQRCSCYAVFQIRSKESGRVSKKYKEQRISDLMKDVKKELKLRVQPEQLRIPKASDVAA